MENYKHSEITEKIIKEVYYIYNKLGFGFFEKVYGNALALRLKKKGLDVKVQYPVNVYFDGEIIGEYIADILVEDKVIIELKAMKDLQEIHEVQLVNYLKTTGVEVGLLFNFGEELKIKRKVFSKDLHTKNILK